MRPDPDDYARYRDDDAIFLGWQEDLSALIARQWEWACRTAAAIVAWLFGPPPSGRPRLC